jgi:hypothetical protein
MVISPPEPAEGPHQRRGRTAMIIGASSDIFDASGEPEHQVWRPTSPRDKPEHRGPRVSRRVPCQGRWPLIYDWAHSDMWRSLAVIGTMVGLTSACASPPTGPDSVVTPTQ